MDNRRNNRDRPSLNRGGYMRDEKKSGGFSFSKERNFSRRPREDRPRSAYMGGLSDRPSFRGGDKPSFRSGGDRPSFRDRPPRNDQLTSVISMELINGGIPPKYMTSGASGMDIYTNKNFTIEGKKIVHVTTGIIIKSLPPRMAINIRSRSSLAKDGLLLLSPTSEEDIKNKELILTFFNVSEETIEIKEGDRIAQIICMKSEKVASEISETFSDTKRNTGGFGSTNNQNSEEDLETSIDDDEDEDDEE